ncbi:MAG: hypothetical protein Kow00109_03860 [Acidobacteriota bacterium]
MKLRYMVEYALPGRIREPRYELVGVRVQGPGSGWDPVIEFLDWDTEARARAVLHKIISKQICSNSK